MTQEPVVQRDGGLKEPPFLCDHEGGQMPCPGWFIPGYTSDTVYIGRPIHLRV